MQHKNSKSGTANHKRNGQAGESLIGVLIVLLIFMLMAAALAPNAIRATQSKNASAAAAWAMQINTAEFAYKSYGGYVQPQNLTGVLGSPLAACANPLLVPGGIVGTTVNPAAPAIGYTFTFQGTGTGTACAGGPTVYSAYSLTVDPTNPLEGGRRHFFTCTGAGCDGQIHYRDTANAADRAQESDPPYSTTLVPAGGSGNGGGTTPSAPTVILAGPWNPSGTYAPGQEVLYTPPNSPTSLFINLTGANSPSNAIPSGDALNWLPIGAPFGGTATPSLAGAFGGGIGMPAGSFYWCPFVGSSCNVTITNTSTIANVYSTLSTSFTMAKFTATISPNTGAAGTQVWIQPKTPNAPWNVVCTIPANSSSCTQTFNPPIVIPSGEGLETVVIPGLSQNVTSLSWVISSQ